MYMEKRDRAKNLLRFYEVDRCVTLFGDTAVVRRWGRIGTYGRIEYQWCSSPEEAEQERLRSIERKQRRGYAVIGDVEDAQP